MILPELVGHVFALLVGYFADVADVFLVGTEHYVRVLAVGVHLQLRDPVPHVHKGGLIRHVEQQDETHGISEESSGQTAEPKINNNLFINCIFCTFTHLHARFSFINTSHPPII